MQPWSSIRLLAGIDCSHSGEVAKAKRIQAVHIFDPLVWLLVVQGLFILRLLNRMIFLYPSPELNKVVLEFARDNCFLLVQEKIQQYFATLTEIRKPGIRRLKPSPELVAA